MGKAIKSIVGSVGSLVGLGHDPSKDLAAAQREQTRQQEAQRQQQAEADRQRMILDQNRAADLAAQAQGPEVVAGGSADQADDANTRRRRAGAAGLASALGINV